MPTTPAPNRRIAILRAARLSTAFDSLALGLDGLWAEDEELVRAFRSAGCDARSVVWNGPNIAWGEFDAAIVRSTWDYIDDVDGFLGGLASIAASCLLLNDHRTIAWNARKRYLLDLLSRGVPVIPTRLVERASDASSVPEAWSKLVVKPEVSIGAAGTHVIPRAALDARVAKARGVQIVQPFVESVVSEGEWSFVYLGGVFSHAILKRPAAGDYRVQSIYGGSVCLADPDPRDRSDADAVLSALDARPLLARVDMARLDGRLHLMELELIEPVLFLGLAPEASGRLVAATLDRLRT